MSSSKIISLDSISKKLEPFRAQGKKIIQCHGVFDLLHPGHIRHFELAKKLGDILVVSITKDQFVNKGPGRPAFQEHLRAESLAALEKIDFVVINETPTASEAIREIKPSFYVKGSDYSDRAADITQGILSEEAEVKKWGGEIHFTNDITFSSTQIINSFFGVYPEKARTFLTGFKATHPLESIMSSFENLESLKVLLIGDTIVDEYRYCQPLGKSPKETIVSTKYLGEESFPGGIIACANHIASFSKHVDLVTCLGNMDSKQEVIEQQLNSQIKPTFFYRDDAPTTTKRRYVEPAFLTKMFQVSFMNDTDLPKDVESKVLNHLVEALPKYDLVFVADYGHGFMTKEIREILMEKSKFLAVNVQSNSANHGYNLVTKYHKANYISIDEPELRLATGRKYDPIHDIILDFAATYDAKTTITVTRGHNGSLTCRSKKDLFEAPCFSTKVVDRVGAGDAYFSVTAMLAAQQAPIDLMGFAGNAAGAMAVEIVCNRTAIQKPQFMKFVKAALS